MNNQHNFSLLPIRDGNKFLLYYDEDWHCWLFINFYHPPTDKMVKENLSKILQVTTDDIKLDYVLGFMRPKISERDGIRKNYCYHVYRTRVLSMTAENKQPFTINNKIFQWMTIEELKNDTISANKNADVIKLVEQLYEGGQL